MQLQKIQMSKNVLRMFQPPDSLWVKLQLCRLWQPVRERASQEGSVRCTYTQPEGLCRGCAGDANSVPAGTGPGLGEEGMQMQEDAVQEKVLRMFQLWASLWSFLPMLGLR